MTDTVRVSAALEAILMVADQPISISDLAAGLDQPPEVIAEILHQLQAEFAGELGSPPRGWQLREVAQGWRIYSSPEYAPEVGQFLVRNVDGKLSGPALETLAVIAYKQPVTRGVIAQVRGVNVDGVIRTLLARDLIESAGVTASGALMYQTTSGFLQLLGLKDLSELPPLAPHLPHNDELDQIAQQLKE